MPTGEVCSEDWGASWEGEETYTPEYSYVWDDNCMFPNTYPPTYLFGFIAMVIFFFDKKSMQKLSVRIIHIFYAVIVIISALGLGFIANALLYGQIEHFNRYGELLRLDDLSYISFTLIISIIWGFFAFALFMSFKKNNILERFYRLTWSYAGMCSFLYIIHILDGRYYNDIFEYSNIGSCLTYLALITLFIGGLASERKKKSFIFWTSIYTLFTIVLLIIIFTR